MLTDQEDSAPPPQHWSWKKITLCFLTIFLTFAVVLIAYDEKLEPYDDLVPAPIKVIDSNANGYSWLRERWEKRPQASSRDREKIYQLLEENQPWDTAWIDQLLASESSLKGDLRNAVSMPDFATPVQLNPQDVGTDTPTWLMHPFRLLVLEMESRGRSGDWDGALAIRKDLHTLVHRYMQGSNSLMALLVALSLNSVLCENTCNLLQNEMADEAKLAELAGLWQTDLPFLAAWEQSTKIETQYSRTFIPLLRKGVEIVPGRPTPWLQRIFTKPHQTINLLHEERRVLLREAFRISPSKPVPFYQDEPSPPQWWRYLNANYYGKMLAESNDAYGKIIPGMTEKAFFRPRALRVSIAIHRWQLANPGKWPGTLQELLPEFLTEIPTDPWNGQPLQWDSASKVIYGVGSDWSLGPANFIPTKRAWFAEHREAPGLRMELPPLPPASAPKSSAKKTAPKKSKPAPGPGNPVAPAPATAN